MISPARRRIVSSRRRVPPSISTGSNCPRPNASYLIEDVFRIGDYIEGGNAKGTVERITFRTVALRHQSGPLHFVPYGTLGSVRNNSRDWVVDKFEIPLPVAVDGSENW
jgi:small-conductance mechanosensitive channel